MQCLAEGVYSLAESEQELLKRRQTEESAGG